MWQVFILIICFGVYLLAGAVIAYCFWYLLFLVFIVFGIYCFWFSNLLN